MCFVTGQLRNATDNIDNWLATFKDYDVTFIFVIWDQIGNVDPDKIYKLCLNRTRKLFVKQVEVSKNNVYLKQQRVLDDEIALIKKKLKKCSIEVISFKNGYLEQIGDLKMNEDLKNDTYPFWRGAIPVAYLNEIAIDYFLKEFNKEDFDYFVRLQGETIFKSESLNFEELITENCILTSPDTIDKKHQISMKFFSGKFIPFEKLMRAYTSSIDVFNNYKKGTPWADQPIGERFLKKIAFENNYYVNHIVETEIKREAVYPINPVYRRYSDVENNWETPIILDVDREIIMMIRSKE